VFSRRVIEAIVEGKTAAESTGAMTGVLDLNDSVDSDEDPVVLPKERVSDPATLRGAVQRTMSEACGVVRDEDSLKVASETLVDLTALATDLPARSQASYEVIDLLRMSRAIVAAAAARTESRGAHFRADYPEPFDGMLGRFIVRGAAAPVFVALPGVSVGR
jgi:L-aspartate oxidase